MPIGTNREDVRWLQEHVHQHRRNSRRRYEPQASIDLSGWLVLRARASPYVYARYGVLRRPRQQARLIPGWRNRLVHWIILAEVIVAFVAVLAFAVLWWRALHLT